MRARDHLREREDEARVSRMWRAIETRRSGRSAKPLWVVSAGFAAAALMGLATYAALDESAPPPTALTLRDGDSLPRTVQGAGAIRFSDGSEVATAGATTLDLLENSADEVAFALREGSARFDVEPGGPRRWRVAAAGVEVIVVGTVFDVERYAERVAVRVDRGAVRVRGAGVRDGEQRLEAGQQLEVDLRPAPRPAPPVVEAPTEAEPVEERRPEPPRPTPPPSLSELLDQSDEARARGDVRAAVHLLERAWREHPRDSRAPLAAFTQGRLELDRLGDAVGAAATLTRSLDLGLQPPLRETALALRVEAWGRAGDGRAAVEGARFLSEHPNSDYAERVGRWTEARP